MKLSDEYTLATTEQLQNLYEDLVQWLDRHPDDTSARERLETIETELVKRGVIP